MKKINFELVNYLIYTLIIGVDILLIYVAIATMEECTILSLLCLVACIIVTIFGVAASDFYNLELDE